MDNATDELTKHSWRTAFWQRSLPTAGRSVGDVPGYATQAADDPTARRALLDCYIRGWAEANPLKIVLVTAPDYRFNDPFIGAFDRASLPRYFETLRTKFAVAGVTQRREAAFSLHGADDVASSPPVLQFYREASHLGLTGTSTITLGDRGIVAETVVYDSNMALEVLARPLSDHGMTDRRQPAPEIAA